LLRGVEARRGAHESAVRESGCSVLQSQACCQLHQGAEHHRQDSLTITPSVAAFRSAPIGTLRLEEYRGPRSCRSPAPPSRSPMLGHWLAQECSITLTGVELLSLMSVARSFPSALSP